jgi:vacuolar-type H+-ATPase subunit E/Vma4
MSLDDLEREIHQEASKTAREIGARAASEAGAILADAKSKARAKVDAAEAAANQKVRAMQEELESSVYVDCKDALLRGVEENVKRNLLQLRREVLALMKKSYASKTVPKIVKRAKKVFEGYDPKEVIAEGDRSSLQQFSKLGYSVKPARFDGVVLKSKDGKVKLDATFASMLDENEVMMRNVMALAVREKAAAMKDWKEIVDVATASGKKAVAPKPKAKAIVKKSVKKLLRKKSKRG